MTIRNAFSMTLTIMALLALLIVNPAFAAGEKEGITKSNEIVASMEKIDINQADAKTLTTLKGIGKDRAVKIIQYREKNGPFEKIGITEAKKGEKRANSFLGFLEGGVGLLATTAAFVSTQSPAYITDAIVNTIGTANHYISNDKQIKSELEMISEEKELVSEEIFRSCQIEPGEVVSGYVYFTEHSDTEYYMFCFPVEDQLFQFVYKQEKSIVYD